MTRGEHWEGNTLVVVTTNFIGGHLGIGPNRSGVPYSGKLRLVERFTRADDRIIQHTDAVDDSRSAACAEEEAAKEKSTAK